MRKFWMVLLALGLVVAFSMPAFAAVDGKFSGSLRVRGWYDDNLLSLDKDKYNGATMAPVQGSSLTTACACSPNSRSPKVSP